MSVWLGLALVTGGLIAVAFAVLASDIARGDVGGGRHTLQRARRLLVVSTDEQTAKGADRWIDEQHRERPDMQFFVLTGPDDQALYLAVEDCIDRDRPDGIVVARPAAVSHGSLDGLYGRLKEDLRLPVDAIYVTEEGVV